MPEQETLERAHEDEREGKSPSTQVVASGAQSLKTTKRSKSFARGQESGANPRPSAAPLKLAAVV